MNDPFVGSEGVTLPKTSENVSERKIEHARTNLGENFKNRWKNTSD